MELMALLGRGLDDEAVKALFRSLGPGIVKGENEDPDADPDDKIDEDGGAYHIFQRAGISLFFGEQNLLETMFIYSEGREGFGEYKGELPGGVVFTDQRADVVRKLGEPAKQGGGGKSQLYGIVPQWIRYDSPEHALHVEFKPEGPVAMITLMTAASAP